VIAAAVVTIVAGSVLLLGRTAPLPMVATPSAAPSGATIARPHPKPGHEVYGFVPYWELDDGIAAHLATTRATTIALFSVTHTSRGAIDMRQPGYRRITGPIGRRIVTDAHDRGVRVDLTYTSFGRDRNNRLFGSTELQDRIIAGLVDLRSTLGMDGIAVDVEEIDPLSLPAYGGFVARLRAALVAASPAATVTATTGAGRGGAALAAAATIAGADRIFLMGYDYRTVGSEPGSTAPLARRDGDERTLPWSLDLYGAAGVPPERTVLGLPLYGLAWRVATPDVGGAAAGSGAIWVPRQNRAALENPAAVPGYDATEDASVLFVPDGSRWTAIYYDTPTSLEPKLALADDRGLAGAGLWALGYERGLPGYTELISRFGAGRLEASPAP
jgi:chitinase